MLALAGVWLLIGAGEIAREIAQAAPGESVGSRLVHAVPEALQDMFAVAVVALAMSGVVYLSYLRTRGVTFFDAIFNWAMVVAVAVLAILVVVL
jgi:hypothetical protein